jgi:hypothetical protein
VQEQDGSGKSSNNSSNSVNLPITIDGVGHGVLGFHAMHCGRWLPRFLTTVSVFYPEEVGSGFLGIAVNRLLNYMVL